MEPQKDQATAGQKVVIEARMRAFYMDANGLPVWHKLAAYERAADGRPVEVKGMRNVIGGGKTFGGGGAGEGCIVLNFKDWAQLPDSKGGGKFVEEWKRNPQKQNEVELRRRVVHESLKPFLTDESIPLVTAAANEAEPAKEKKKPGPKPGFKRAAGQEQAAAR